MRKATIVFVLILSGLAGAAAAAAPKPADQARTQRGWLLKRLRRLQATGCGLGGAFAVGFAFCLLPFAFSLAFCLVVGTD